MIMRALFIGCIVWGAGIVFSCNQCPDTKSYETRYAKVDIQTGLYRALHSTKYFMLTDDSISMDTFVSFRIQFSSELVASSKPLINSFFNSAYATDCTEDRYTPVVYPISWKVITLRSLNATYPAGSDITPLMLEVPEDGSQPYIVPELQGLRTPALFVSNREKYLSLGITGPFSDTVQQFVFIYEMNDSKVLTDTTGLIKRY